MSKLLTPLDALALVPGWDASNADIVQLQGGLTNRTYRVRYLGDEFVLRLDRAQSSSTQVDRSLEVAIQGRAHVAGLAPKVLFSASGPSVMLRQYLPGQAWGQSDLRSHENLEALAATIRRVHELPLSGCLFDLETYARAYEQEIEAAQAGTAFVSKCVGIVCNTPIVADAVCSHNDLVAENVVDYAGLQLIDWEYAADNDPLFDLASVIAYHDLDEESAEVILNTYLGYSNAEWRERLAGQCRLFDALQWLWLASRSSADPNPWQMQRLATLQMRIRQ